MNSICIIYNFAQKYREGIYKLLEQHYDCHWCFGQNDTDIKGLDLTLLRDVEMLRNVRVVGNWYWQKGAVRQLREHRTVLMLGELFCLSTWTMLLLRHLFYRNRRIYLWSHGWYGRETRSKSLLKRWFFALADGVALYGHHAEKEARRQGYSKDNLCVIHNSLDYDRQLQLRQVVDQSSLASDLYQSYFSNADPVILFIGRLTPIKRLDMLVEALSSLSQRDCPCNLVLVGGGEEEAHLKTLVHQQGLDSRVWFYGPCYDEQENARLVYHADLCVAPGNVGLTAMHSLVYGTPVITHDDFGNQMPEFEAIRPGQTGDFFRYGDVSSLAETVARWLSSHREQRSEIRKHCYEEIDRYWTPAYQLQVIQKMLS